MIKNCPMRHENGNCIPAGGFCTANKNICEALLNAYRIGKAQLSQEGKTSDLISRTETVEHLRRMLEATVPNTDYDEGFIDGVEFGISTVSTMPTIQPQSTTGQLNDGARSTAQSTDLIDRQAARHALCKAVHKGEDIPCENQTASCLWTGTRVCDFVREIDALPTIQPEPQEGEWVQIQRCTGDAQPDLECPFCKHRIGWWDMGRYCAGCGAKLEGGAG